MSTLAIQQQALLETLFAWPAEDAVKNLASCVVGNSARGLKVYQSNGHALAERALQSAYPVISQLVGPESFADLCRALWHAHPPVRGDIAQWGQALVAFLRTSAQLQDEPYLADVADAEWALHACASATDAAPDLATMALLTTHEPEQLHFGLAPGCTVVQSAWPVASILSAHLEQTPSFAEVGQQLRAGVAQDAVVWRSGLRPTVRLALAGEAAFVTRLLNGAALAQALDGAPDLDFGAWLPKAVTGGLVLSVRLQASTHDALQTLGKS
jgi:Putative DNA-binding domain